MIHNRTHAAGAHNHRGEVRNTSVTAADSPHSSVQVSAFPTWVMGGSCALSPTGSRLSVLSSGLASGLRGGPHNGHVFSRRRTERNI